jgi:hypothetical protein
MCFQLLCIKYFTQFTFSCNVHRFTWSLQKCKRGIICLFICLFVYLFIYSLFRGSSVIIVSGYGLSDWGLIPGRCRRILPIAFVSRSALGPTQPPAQCVLGVLFPRLKRSQGGTLTTNPYLVPRSRMCRSYTPPPLKCLHGVLWDSISLLWFI